MRVCLSTLIIIGTAAIIGCDERNPPDLPTTIYTLKKNIVTPGVALGVAADENLLAVAASSAGTFVYDITSVGEPEEVFHFEPAGQLYIEFVGIDATNGLVQSVAAPDLEPGDKYPIHRLSDGQRIGGAAFSGGIFKVKTFSALNEFNSWRTDQSDGDGLGVSSYCYNPDSARWRPEYCSTFNTSYLPSNGVRLRGFDARDNVFAIAQTNYELRLYSPVDAATISRFSTPGDPHDVVWRGDYLFIADYYHLTVVNVANLDTPVVVKTLTIPGADRLQRIVVEGNYATLLDDADGLYVVDISTATDPKHVQTINLPEVSAVTATNGKIIASDEQLGVLIYER